jgi:nitroreductase
MEFQNSSRPVNAFAVTSKPVPREVIEEIISVAKWSPSSMNTQPWHVHPVTGEPLERIRRVGF